MSKQTFDYILVNRAARIYTYDHGETKTPAGWERVLYSADTVRGLIYDPFPAGFESDMMDYDD